MTKKEIIEKGKKEAYNELVKIVLSDVAESLRGSYEYYEFLDFSSEVFDYILDELANDENSPVLYEILKPAINEITERVQKVLKKEIDLDYLSKSKDS